MRTVILGMLACMTLSFSLPDEKMLFVFEVVRHGARAPIIDMFLDEFKVAEGQLTAEGMRQRYLLGRSSRQRYTEEFEFLSPNYVPGEVFVQSTDVNRTLTSGYSELMGIYPPGLSGAPQLTTQEQNQLNSVAAPPFKVRNSKQVNERLGSYALPRDYTAVPIVTYINGDLHDDVQYKGCNYIQQSVNMRDINDTIYAPYWNLVDETRHPIRVALDLTIRDMDTASYQTINNYADTIRSMSFEGAPFTDTFTSTTWLEMEEIQKVYLTLMYSDQTRSLLVSRLLRKPI